MLPDRVSNPGPLTYESGALPIALRGPAATAPKDILSLQGNTSKTIITLRISNNLPVLNQNYNIDQSEIVYMYVSCTYVLKVRRSS